MSDETLENSTLEQEPTLRDVMNELVKINQRLDTHDAQFEAIRTGIVANGIDFERLSAKVSNLSADVRELTEEARREKLALK